MWNDNYNKIVTKDINGGPYLRMHLLTSYYIIPWDLCRPQAPPVLTRTKACLGLGFWPGIPQVFWIPQDTSGFENLNLGLLHPCEGDDGSGSVGFMYRTVTYRTVRYGTVVMMTWYMSSLTLYISLCNDKSIKDQAWVTVCYGTPYVWYGMSVPVPYRTVPYRRIRYGTVPYYRTVPYTVGTGLQVPYRYRTVR